MKRTGNPEFQDGDLVEIYPELQQDSKDPRKYTGQWRWRWKAGNNRIVADSGESYKSLKGCLRAAKRLNKGRSRWAKLQIKIIK